MNKIIELVRIQFTHVLHYKISLLFNLDDALEITQVYHISTTLVYIQWYQGQIYARSYSAKAGYCHPLPQGIEPWSFP